MINIEISKEDFKRPEVYGAVLQLLEALNGTPAIATTAIVPSVKKRANARRANYTAFSILAYWTSPIHRAARATAATLPNQSFE